MYRSILLLAVVFFTFLIKPAKAQDIIVRIYGDSIFCKVDKTDELFVYYRTPETERDSREIISKKEVREILYNADPDPDGKIKPHREELSYEKFGIGLDAGYSLIFEPDNDFGEDFEDYYDELRYGTYIHASMTYFVNEELGFSAAFSRSWYENQVDVVLTPGNVQGKLSDERVISYYALSLSYRIQTFRSGNILQLDAGAGFLQYQSRSSVVYPYKIEANSVGAHLIGSFHLSLGGGFYLPLKVAIRGFNVYDMNFEPGAEMPADLAEDLTFFFANETGINLTRVEFGVGLIFAF